MKFFTKLEGLSLSVRGVPFSADKKGAIVIPDDFGITPQEIAQVMAHGCTLEPVVAALAEAKPEKLEIEVQRAVDEALNKAARTFTARQKEFEEKRESEVNEAVAKARDEMASTLQLAADEVAKRDTAITDLQKAGEEKDATIAEQLKELEARQATITMLDGKVTELTIRLDGVTLTGSAGGSGGTQGTGGAGAPGGTSSGAGSKPPTGKK